MHLKGKTALVTGGAQGIGRAIALNLAMSGADVAVSDINLDMARKTADELAALGVKSAAIGGNVADSESAKKMVDEAVEALGGLFILVNNAGITRDNLIMRMKDEDWDLVLSINLKGAFLCTKSALKYMSKQRGG